jgi:hypothetical protein
LLDLLVFLITYQLTHKTTHQTKKTAKRRTDNIKRQAAHMGRLRTFSTKKGGFLGRHNLKQLKIGQKMGRHQPLGMFEGVFLLMAIF